MRVNTSLLIAAVTLVSAPGFQSALMDPKELEAYSKYFEERSAVPTRPYTPTVDASDSDEPSVSPSTGDASDTLQNDEDIHAIHKSNKQVLNNALGSAAGSDDHAKLNALYALSEDDLHDILHNMTSTKPGVPSKTGLASTVSTKSSTPMSSTSNDSDTDDYATWTKYYKDENLGPVEDASGSNAYPSIEASPTKNYNMDTEQFDYDDDVPVTHSKTSKNDDDLGLGAAAGGATMYSATKGKSGKIANGDINKYPSSASDDSSENGSLDDWWPISKHSSKGSYPMTDGSDMSDLYSKPSSAYKPKPTSKVDDDDLYTPLPDESTSKPSSSVYKPKPTSKVDDDDLYASLPDEPISGKPSSKSASLYTDGSDDDFVYKTPDSKNVSPYGQDPTIGGKTGLTSPFDDEKEKKLDEILKRLSDDHSDDSSESGSLSDMYPPIKTNPHTANLDASTISANKNKLEAAVGPAAAAGGGLGVLNSLTKMDQKELDAILESLSKPGSIDTSDDGSDALDLSYLSEKPKGQKMAYTPPTGSMSDPYMDDLLSMSDKKPKGPTVADLLKKYPMPGSLDSETSSGSSADDDKSADTDADTPAPTPAPTPEPEKPCHVSWWRKLAFWHSEHKCSESRRLRLDFN
ncbi:hypothetical protein Plhal304r1_c077g0164231 [Plasmopara halstedii]